MTNTTTTAYDADDRVQTARMAPGDLPQTAAYLAAPSLAAFTSLVDLSYTYDAAGNQTGVTDTLGGENDSQYDPAGGTGGNG